MTVQPLSGLPIYTVSGTGPYAVTFGFSAIENVGLLLLQSGVWIDMPEDDWALTSVTPSPTDTFLGGGITLASGAAAALAGRKIRPYRLTPAEQGWRGVAAREVGNERQQDLTVRAVQELQHAMARAVRTTGTNRPIEPKANALLMFDENGQPIAGPDAAELQEATSTIELNVLLSQEARALAQTAASTAVASAQEAGGFAVQAFYDRIAASSSAMAANTALLALGDALVNGIGAFSVDADGNLVVQYNDAVIDDVQIDANGNFLITYEVS